MIRKFLGYLQRRFNVVIFWGLPDNDGPVGEITAHGIEKVFMQGCCAAMSGNEPPCPYPEHSLHRHWYTRGFAYMARFKRAIEAEELLRVERVHASDLESRLMMQWTRAETAERSLKTLAIERGHDARR